MCQEIPGQARDEGGSGVLADANPPLQNVASASDGTSAFSSSFLRKQESPEAKEIPGQARDEGWVSESVKAGESWLNWAAEVCSAEPAELAKKASSRSLWQTDFATPA